MSKKVQNSIDALLSVAPNYSHKVEINGLEIEVFPVSLMSLAKLLRRYPEALKVIMGEHEKPEMAIVNCGPEAISALIAAGTGNLNDIETEQKIAKLPDEWQLEMLGEIIKITMPNGLEDFLAKLVKLLEKMGMTK